VYFRKDRRFLVIDQMQFILIEPDTKKVGWGIVKFCDLMQVSRYNFFPDFRSSRLSTYLLFKDVDVANDKEDSRSLHITIHKPVNNIYVKTSPPILNAKFTFDDHIRCMTAKQNLIKGRQRY
jgi:protein CLEC16A